MDVGIVGGGALVERGGQWGQPLQQDYRGVGSA